ncbi:gluconokinase [Corynebacterium choanae]|uniref:Gluconokinase n=1 Tax=Corynebacterium choanae TaxID=1862358 RepID=A0A3G6J549_9CORY|nr:gluconokinase [Corynebacterium choanae]AZA12873.1 Thermoresistant gluconokinase [Corynebacterium choanae]
MTVTQPRRGHLSLAYSQQPTHYVCMGISGCGKSTIGQAFADSINGIFVDGDDFHPRANIAKMSAGIPLTDQDRWPWLASIVDYLAASTAQQQQVVVACSALKHAYREQLRQAPGNVVFIHLELHKDTVRERMSQRMGHFMPVSLLSSQLATLEPLRDDECGITVFNDADPSTVVQTIHEQCAAELAINPRLT